VPLPATSCCNITLSQCSEFCSHNPFHYQYCAGGKIEKNEMGGACGTCGGGERCAQGSGGEA